MLSNRFGAFLSLPNQDALSVVILGLAVFLFSNVTNNATSSISNSTSSSANAISEAIKFLVSVALYYKAWNRQEHAGKESSLESGEGLGEWIGHPGTIIGGIKSTLARSSGSYLSKAVLVYAVSSALTVPTSFTAESSTIGFFRAGIVVLSGVAMLLTTQSKISGQLWLAIFLQLYGVIGIQNDFYTGIAPLSAVIFTFGQASVFAFSTVFIHDLYQNSDLSSTSFHAHNMILFGSSFVLNLLLSSMELFSYSETITTNGSTSLGFSLPSIIANTATGLAIVFVLRHHDALTTTFTMLFSTAILITITSIIQGSLSILFVNGVFTTALSAYSFYTSKSRQESQKQPSAFMDPIEPSNRSFRLTTLSKRSIALSTAGGLFILAMISQWQYKPEVIPEPSFSVFNLTSNATIEGAMESPFKNTIAYIRINNDLPEREKLVRKAYGPFFHSIHISMPNEDHKPEETTLLRNYWKIGELAYVPVQKLLDLVLEEAEDPDSSYASVDGLLYFHFDAWIEPLSFHDMDFERIWVLSTTGLSQPLKYECMGPKANRNPNWWWFHASDWGVDKALAANKMTKLLVDGLAVDQDRFCIGWSDLYFIPRKYLPAYATLAKAYAVSSLFHEVVIPTIWDIIDRTYSAHSSYSVLYKWGDCFGGCCDNAKLREELLDYRCGHRMDYRDWNVTSAHFERLERNSRLLGTRIETDPTVAPFIDL